MDKLIPLCDDLDEWAARSWWRALLVALFPKSCLAMRLRTQLKARPKTWGIGLWADKETEDVAYACAECFYYAFPCGSLNFVPDDPIDVIAAFDPQGDLCSHAAVLYIEQEFECVVPDSALSNCTFGEFVAAVMKARNKGNGNL